MCSSDLSAVNLKEGRKRFAGPSLIVQVGKDGQPLHSDLEALQETYPVADLQGIVEEPFWKEIKRWYWAAPNLFEITLAWMAAR